jgi:hypothetical protein
MLERLLFRIISQEIAQIRAQPRRLTHLFRYQAQLEQTEFDAICTYLESTNIAVTHNYPRKAPTFPCYTIVLGREREERQFLGHDGEILRADDPEVLAGLFPEATSTTSSFYSSTYHIYVVTQQPDHTIYLYQILKWILTLNKDALSLQGIHVSILEGSDVAPDKDYMPESLFIRQLNVTLRSEFKVISEELPELGAFTEVGGIHVNSEFEPPLNVVAEVEPVIE